MSTTIVCERVKSHLKPGSDSSYRKCDECGEMIWLALDSPKPDQLLCVECFKEAEEMDKAIFHLSEEHL
jgi:formylmethanofuran dehydrogenase subunit E